MATKTAPKAVPKVSKPVVKPKAKAVAKPKPKSTTTTGPLLSGPVTAEIIMAVSPRMTSVKAKQIADSVNKWAKKYGQTSHMVLAHFIGQNAHESKGFTDFDEDGGPKYWARYEGRTDLGNTQPGDGIKFHGRGPTQLTGRANYAKFGKLVGVDLITYPEKAAELDIGMHIAFEYWKQRRIFAMAARNDVIAVTKAINGGSNGLADRKRLTQIAIEAFPDVDNIEADALEPVLAKGDESNYVLRVQEVLSGLGYHTGVIDGVFGDILEGAVIKFQQNNNLRVDGVVGRQTWDALGNPAAIPFSAPESRESLEGKDLVDAKEPIATSTWYQRLYAKIQTALGLGTATVSGGTALGILNPSEWGDNVTSSVSTGRSILDVLGISTTQAVITVGLVFGGLGLISWYLARRTDSINTENYKSGKTL